MGSWYYAQGGQQLGPFEFEQLQGLAAQNRLAANDLVWTEGLAQWQQAAQINGLFAAPASASPPYVQPAVYAGQSIGYQTPPYAPPSQHSGLALTGMILSLSSLIAGPLLAIAGAICGWVALAGMKRTGDTRNRGFALAAVWIGVLYVVLIVGGILLFIGIMVAAQH
jgi:hypothetical protein